MYARCFCRLSHASLSNAQHLFSNQVKPPSRPRLSPDLWRSFLLQEQHALNPHPNIAAQELRAIAAPQETNYFQIFNDTHDDDTPAKPRGSFLAQASTASIGVAELAAALALSSFGTMVTLAIAEPPCTMSPTSMQSPSRLTPITVLDQALTVPTSHNQSTTATPPAAAAATAAASATTTTTPVPPAPSPCPVAIEGTLSGLAAAKAAPLASTIADEARPGAASSCSDLHDRDPHFMTAPGTTPGIATLLGAWPHIAPTITAMLGAGGNGPGGQVRFALVPLGEDYATRAEAAQREAQLGRGGDGAATAPGGGGGAYATDLAVQYGLDVALAAAAAPDGGRNGVRRLELCPAMVIRAGYTGSTRTAYGGEVCPGWSMRQELDEHVRRNLQLAEQRQQYRQRQQLRGPHSWQHRRFLGQQPEEPERKEQAVTPQWGELRAVVAAATGLDDVVCCWDSCIKVAPEAEVRLSERHRVEVLMDWELLRWLPSGFDARLACAT
ncbi:hypothetical protein VOLCADRAFT_92632 [Volvox carteri f. nagariensis]|uniref:Uncharacterized protein n=1 Tax=Volvox carteri f. nagariensis TaxID=3068 RepID=D8U056_VOLCA|nr:uncharacterized protein VOLCADRAFT_92632 [Volvox carteri f. nagariensis]EFJ46879.1 hypothetical protein VOLCADRAFT_92632 [Volvox carteri f. nagariensis]|eukprot:XP_002952088.1 hypothetical protein VOLCADRAFT_92632 [Volvox carteri f. nagariensis]